MSRAICFSNLGKLNWRILVSRIGTFTRRKQVSGLYLWVQTQPGVLLIVTFFTINFQYSWESYDVTLVTNGTEIFAGLYKTLGLQVFRVLHSSEIWTVCVVAYLYCVIYKIVSAALAYCNLKQFSLGLLAHETGWAKIPSILNTYLLLQVSI